MVTALSIRDDHSSTSGRYTLTDEEDDRVDLKLNPVAGRRWVDPRARWVAASLAPHLHADSPEHARDILTATVLCECSYKSPESHVRERVAELSREFPPFAVRLSGVSASVEGRARRRYLVARAPGVTYVAFTGTREAMDFLADASFLQTPLAEGLGLGSDVKSSGGGGRWCTGVSPRAPREVRAHVRAAWRRARERGDRFVLCGHSLGGAVATLAAVAILAESDESRSAELRCVAFASPPVGNSALRRAVWERGWGPAFTNVCVPEDPVPRLLFTPQRGAAAAKVDGPRQPPTRDNSREANAARRLPRLVPMVRRSDETRGDGWGERGQVVLPSCGWSSHSSGVRPPGTHTPPVTRRWYRLVGRSCDIGRRRRRGRCGRRGRRRDRRDAGGRAGCHRGRPTRGAPSHHANVPGQDGGAVRAEPCAPGARLSRVRTRVIRRRPPAAFRDPSERRWTRRPTHVR